MKSSTSSNGNDREAHEQENVTETAEKVCISDFSYICKLILQYDYTPVFLF
jgi:hypothetical protein